MANFQNANFFSISFDETTDISGSNIMTLVVRYLKKKLKSMRNLLDFLMSLKSLKNFLIKNQLKIK